MARVVVVSILTVSAAAPQVAWLMLCVLMGVGYVAALWAVASEQIPRSEPVDTPPNGGVL